MKLGLLVSFSSLWMCAFSSCCATISRRFWRRRRNVRGSRPILWALRCGCSGISSKCTERSGEDRTARHRLSSMIVSSSGLLIHRLIDWLKTLPIKDWSIDWLIDWLITAVQIDVWICWEAIQKWNLRTNEFWSFILVHWRSRESPLSYYGWRRPMTKGILCWTSWKLSMRCCMTLILKRLDMQGRRKKTWKTVAPPSERCVPVKRPLRKRTRWKSPPGSAPFTFHLLNHHLSHSHSSLHWRLHQWTAWGGGYHSLVLWSLVFFLFVQHFFFLSQALVIRRFFHDAGLESGQSRQRSGPVEAGLGHHEQRLWADRRQADKGKSRQTARHGVRAGTHGRCGAAGQRSAAHLLHPIHHRFLQRFYAQRQGFKAVYKLKPPISLIDWLICMVTGCLIVHSFDWLIDRLIHRLIDWLIEYNFSIWPLVGWNRRKIYASFPPELENILSFLQGCHRIYPHRGHGRAVCAVFLGAAIFHRVFPPPQRRSAIHHVKASFFLYIPLSCVDFSLFNLSLRELFAMSRETISTESVHFVHSKLETFVDLIRTDKQQLALWSNR